MKGPGRGVYNEAMEYYVLKLAPLRGRMDEAMARLSAQRRARAERLRREEARRQSVGAGLLLAFFYPGRETVLLERGKPAVPGAREFSLSHNGELAVIARADVPVGADVQRLGRVSEALRRRVLTPEEQRRTAQLGEEEFFRLWTRKEAALKCLGIGLDRPPASFDVCSGRVTLDGCELGLYTVRFGEYMLSAAALGETAEFTPRELTLDELLLDREAGSWN